VSRSDGNYIQLGYVLPKCWAKSKKERRRIGRRIRRENRKLGRELLANALSDKILR
jgi:hypothetical protein